MVGACHTGKQSYPSLLLQLPHELVRPRLLLLPPALLLLELLGPLLLDVLPHGAERLAEVLLVAFDDDLQLADRLSLLAQQLVLVAVRRVGRELRPCEERRLEGQDLRRLSVDLPPSGEELLLQLKQQALVTQDD